jgi:hypothetical protein
MVRVGNTKSIIKGRTRKRSSRNDRETVATTVTTKEKRGSGAEASTLENVADKPAMKPHTTSVCAESGRHATVCAVTPTSLVCECCARERNTQTDMNCRVEGSSPSPRLEALKNLAETHVEKRLLRENLDSCEEEIWHSFRQYTDEDGAYVATKRLLRFLRENLGV